MQGRGSSGARRPLGRRLGLGRLGHRLGLGLLLRHLRAVPRLALLLKLDRARALLPSIVGGLRGLLLLALLLGQRLLPGLLVVLLGATRGVPGLLLRRIPRLPLNARLARLRRLLGSARRPLRRVRRKAIAYGRLARGGLLGGHALALALLGLKRLPARTRLLLGRARSRDALGLLLGRARKLLRSWRGRGVLLAVEAAAHRRRHLLGLVGLDVERRNALLAVGLAAEEGIKPILPHTRIADHADRSLLLLADTKREPSHELEQRALCRFRADRLHGHIVQLAPQKWRVRHECERSGWQVLRKPLLDHVGGVATSVRDQLLDKVRLPLPVFNPAVVEDQAVLVLRVLVQARFESPGQVLVVDFNRMGGVSALKVCPAIVEFTVPPALPELGALGRRDHARKRGRVLRLGLAHGIDGQRVFGRARTQKGRALAEVLGDQVHALALGDRRKIQILGDFPLAVLWFLELLHHGAELVVDRIGRGRRLAIDEVEELLPQLCADAVLPQRKEIDHRPLDALLHRPLLGLARILFHAPKREAQDARRRAQHRVEL